MFDIHYLPKSNNQQADALTRMASSAKGLAPPTIICKVLGQPSIKYIQVHTLSITDTWMEEIIAFLRDGTLPSGEKEAN